MEGEGEDQRTPKLIASDDALDLLDDDNPH
jgi:hypothetical protein